MILFNPISYGFNVQSWKKLFVNYDPLNINFSYLFYDEKNNKKLFVH